MQKQEYFVVTLAHSRHGTLRRVHIPYPFLFVVLCLAVVGLASVFGFCASYARMLWKVASYNALRSEADVLKSRFRHLQNEVRETHQQLASLEVFANEVSVAYGLTQAQEIAPGLTSGNTLYPTFNDSLRQFNYLREVAGLRHGRMKEWQMVGQPSIWPVDGFLIDGFGQRMDPFSGEGAIHTGVDISAPQGTPVRASAAGTVVHAEYSGAYGRLIVIDHGNNMATYYAHLSRIEVLPAQQVRQGQLLGAVGSTGRSTGPHLHYEVRIHAVPVNPQRFLRGRLAQTLAVKKDFPF